MWIPCHSKLTSVLYLLFSNDQEKRRNEWKLGTVVIKITPNDLDWFTSDTDDTDMLASLWGLWVRLIPLIKNMTFWGNLGRQNDWYFDPKTLLPPTPCSEITELWHLIFLQPPLTKVTGKWNWAGWHFKPVCPFPVVHLIT